MPIFTVSTLRDGFGDARGRVYAFSRRPANPAMRVLTGLIALAVAALAIVVFLILLIPAVVLVLAVAIYAAIAHSLRRALSSTREPNGILDGRRNVRVITTDRP